LKINKHCYLLHLVGLDFITLPTLKMHGQTQIKKTCHLFVVGAELKTRQAGKNGCTVYAGISFSETSTGTEIKKALPKRINVSAKSQGCPAIQAVSLAATTPCRWQICIVTDLSDMVSTVE
jgi:hypothetical protein